MEEELLLTCCEALVLQSLPFPSPQWQQAEQQLQAAVKALGSRRASPLLLNFLRRPCLPDCVLDALSHSIAVCCGSCSDPPSTLSFKFSPLLCVHIKEMDYVKGGLGWKVWGTALVLSWRLVSLQRSFHGKRVLELGSGCGLCGLLAARLGACEVVLTDYVPDILVNLCENALLLPAATILELKELGQSELKMGPFDFAYEEENAALFSKGVGTMIKVRMLDWAEDASGSTDNELSGFAVPKLSADEKYDWVIGSDLIYNQYSIKSLVGVIKRRLSKGGSSLLAAPVRDNKELNLFLLELDEHGMDAHVEPCLQEEWEACTALLEVEEGGTLQGADHYDGGLVIIHVKHKV